MKLEKKDFLNLLEEISPVVISSKPDAIEIGLSKRFLVFQLLNQVKSRIEDDPYLNFISVLKNYKIFGDFLHGSIYELYRDRNKSYFRNFFPDDKLCHDITQRICWVYERNKKLKVTLTKRGLIIFDNYEKNRFNILLLTIHSGSWVPERINDKYLVSDNERFSEEDILSDRIYGLLVLKKSGIWIDSALSRFCCDYNRDVKKAIYSDRSESWIKGRLWKEGLTGDERNWLIECYNRFYLNLNNIVDSYRFNIIFDGHSMKDDGSRPEISFGTRYIPKFYIPIVLSMRKKMSKRGYDAVLNKPYSGGNILSWLSTRFPDIFTFSMEVNKRLYMDENRIKALGEKLDRLSCDIVEMFDIGFSERK